MTEETRRAKIEHLEPFAGEWEMEVAFPGAPPMGGARTSFEWMPGKLLLVQRWEIPIPEAPDGMAVYGYDERRGTLLQHYFDTRGVARVYEMSFAGGVWKLWRSAPDFSPLSFSQRFEGRLSGDGRRIEGAWEICHDGETWEHDFDMTYTRS